VSRYRDDQMIITDCTPGEWYNFPRDDREPGLVRAHGKWYVQIEHRAGQLRMPTAHARWMAHAILRTLRRSEAAHAAVAARPKRRRK
jgi:hypothetical protein